MSDQLVKQSSEEFEERQRELASGEGKAYDRSLGHMIETGAMTTELLTARGVVTCPFSVRADYVWYGLTARNRP